MRLNSIDNICADISDLTGGFVWSIGKGLLGDLGDMDFSPIKNKSRSQGDFQMLLNVLALDPVDNDLLAGMEPIDLSILGELRLNKIDYICADISSLTGGFVWSIGKGLLGDLGDMDFSPIKNKSRSQGDLQMILNVLALDPVDNDLLAGMEPIDLSILGELRLNKIDYICADISSLTGGFVWAIGKGLLGDLGDMDFSPIKNKSRSQGDVQMILCSIPPYELMKISNNVPKNWLKIYSHFLLIYICTVCIIFI